jgi:hypothetical protein
VSKHLLDDEQECERLAENVTSADLPYDARTIIFELMERLAAERKAHRETEQILRAENERIRHSR